MFVQYEDNPFCSSSAEAFWKYKEDVRGVSPETFAKNCYSTLPSVKEERSAAYCCSPATISTTAHGKKWLQIKQTYGENVYA